MAKQVLQRLSFTAGELSPWLSGRADLDPVARGASRLANFLVTPFGGLRRRPGTRLVARAGSAEDMVRLVSFKYSTGVQFMLELGRGYIRYFKDGAPLADAAGNVLETASPWKTDARIRNLRMQQLNDVIYCVEPETPPMTLSRHADDDWRLERMEFSGMPYERSLLNPVNIEYRLVPSGSVNKLVVTADEDVFTPDMAGREYIRITRRYGEVSAVADQMPLFHLTTLNRDMYAGDTFSMDGKDGWRNTYTCIRNFSKKNDYQAGKDSPEWYASFFRKGADACTYTFVRGTWTVETTGTWDAEWEVRRAYLNGSNYLPSEPSRVWHSVKSFYQKEGFRNNFALSGHEEDFSYYTVSLLAYKNGASAGAPVLRAGACSLDHEFVVDEYVSPRCVHVRNALCWSGYMLDDYDTNDWSFGAFGVRNGYPCTIEFHQGRLWFGSTPGQPQTLWASRVDDFSSFTPGAAADSPMILTMAASQQNRIAWISSLRGLMIGTSEGEWRLKASGSAAISAENAEFERHSGVGSAFLDALTVENSLLFVQQGGRKVREFFYSLEADGFLTRDVSLLSDHLLAQGIVDWTVQRSTAFQVWCVLKDGTAVCMTLNREQNIVAWHAHRLEHARILSVASLRGSRDTPDEEVWFAVERGEGEGACITVECLAEGNAYLDGCTEAAVRGGTISGLRHLAGREAVLLDAEGKGTPVLIDGEGNAPFPEGREGETVKAGLAAPAEVRTMPLETLETLGRMKKQIGARALLHESSLQFLYGTGDAGAWRHFQPGRYGMDAPHSGYVRFTHNYGTDEQSAFALRVEDPVPFHLLALVLDVEL